MKHKQTNQKRAYISLCLISLHVFAVFAWKEPEEFIQISELTNQVHARLYFVERLNKTIQALYQVHTNCEGCMPKKLLKDLHTYNSFSNSIIRNCYTNILEKESLQPIFACWQTIITYKHIDDPSLCIEFSQLIHYLIEKLLIHSKSSQAQHLKKIVPREVEINPATTHNVSFRFYLLKRLMLAYTTLKQYRTITLPSLPNCISFLHPHTAACYIKMQTNQSIQPIAKLFEEVEQYRFINDDLFIHEFLQILFITEASIAQITQPDNHLFYSFEHITSLSITELLEAIDIETGKLEHTHLYKSKTIAHAIEKNFEFSPNHFANYVYRRFYFIERLEHIMNLFQEINREIQADSSHNTSLKNSSFDTSAIFDFHNSFPFKHKRIKKSIRDMEHEHNLKPLFSVWKEFITYKSIEDQLFIEEFTKEIFVISRNMLLCNGICARHLPNIRSVISLPADQLLDVIDMYIDQFLENKPPHNSEQLDLVVIPIRTPDLHQSVHIDDVMLRFYHIHRLGIIFWLLNQINAQHIPLQLAYSQTTSGILIDSQHAFNHEQIVSCIKVMSQTQSIEPLMGLMQGVQRYKYIDDDVFTHEYLMLTLITLQHLKAHTFKEPNQIKSNLKVHDIPLERILDALDLIAVELPALLEKYELQGKLSWKEWFKKYWWAPAIILGTLGIKVYLALRPPVIQPAPEPVRPNSKPTPPSSKNEPFTPPAPPTIKLPKIQEPEQKPKMDSISLRSPHTVTLPRTSNPPNKPLPAQPTTKKSKRKSSSTTAVASMPPTSRKSMPPPSNKINSTRIGSRKSTSDLL